MWVSTSLWSHWVSPKGKKNWIGPMEACDGLDYEPSASVVYIFEDIKGTKLISRWGASRLWRRRRLSSTCTKMNITLTQQIWYIRWSLNSMKRRDPKCKESWRDDSVQQNRYVMLCVCVCVCVWERESRDTRYETQRIRKLKCILTKEKDSTYYKVGGGCFI